MYISRRDLFYHIQPRLRGGVIREEDEEEKKRKTEVQLKEFDFLMGVIQSILRRPAIQLWVHSSPRDSPGGDCWGAITWKEVSVLH